MGVFFTMRLVAPIGSLQAPRIDTHSDTLPVPTRSMVTGLIGAALGIGYAQPEVLQQVQDTMRLAFVVHKASTIERDYHTVRMGLRHMIGPMWWHDGHRLGVIDRKGGDEERTITGERPLTCDLDLTIIVELLSGAPFTAQAILDALREPVHPLGVGQRSCLPTEPIAGNILEAASSLIDAVRRVTRPGAVYLPAAAVFGTAAWGDLYISVPAGRDWISRAHGGTDTYVVRDRAA